MFKKNIFGQIVFFKVLLIKIVGLASYPGMQWVNKLKVKGAEKLKGIPDSNVLFVSNHQTYFADVVAIYHGIFSHLTGRYNYTRFPSFLFTSKHNMYFVAAEETMRSGFLPKLFRYGGAITVKRTWRAKGEEVQREVDPKDPRNIERALHDGWVLTFPQGTTSPFVQGRKGTAHLIKNSDCTVVPVTINGFRRAFDKRGLSFKKKGTTLQVNFKDPIQFSPKATVEDILQEIMDAIEQSEDHLLVPEV